MSNRYSSSSSSLDSKVYVGGLTQSASKDEIEEAFERYGRLRNVFVARNPPGFAFVEYENSKDAEDSVRALDGRTLCGSRVRVELSHGKVKAKNFGGRGGFRDRDRHTDSFRDRRSSRDRYHRRSRSMEKRRSSYSRSSSRSRGERIGRDRRGLERDSRRRISSKSRSRS